MYQIKSELNQILGKLEALEESGVIPEKDLYELLQKAYFVISDSFDIEQCHSTVHELKNHMRAVKGYAGGKSTPAEETEEIKQEALKTCIRELQVFISHL